MQWFSFLCDVVFDHFCRYFFVCSVCGTVVSVYFWTLPNSTMFMFLITFSFNSRHYGLVRPASVFCEYLRTSICLSWEAWNRAGAKRRARHKIGRSVGGGLCSGMSWKAKKKMSYQFPADLGVFNAIIHTSLYNDGRQLLLLILL